MSEAQGKASSGLAKMIGTTPIHPVLFAIAKLALAAVIIAPLVQLAGVPLARPLPASKPIAAALVAIALVGFALAGRALGKSVRMGLPAEETELKTSGIYRISRNPMYLAMFLLAVASSIYVPHPAVLVAAAVAVLLHHRIALAEERFLEARFGEPFRSYSSRVPRYLGFPRG